VDFYISRICVAELVILAFRSMKLKFEDLHTSLPKLLSGPLSPEKQQG
jgi:hypothetical protein